MSGHLEVHVPAIFLSLFLHNQFRVVAVCQLYALRIILTGSRPVQVSVHDRKRFYTSVRALRICLLNCAVRPTQRVP